VHAAAKAILKQRNVNLLDSFMMMNRV
jgi:hypothetical protein